MAKSFLENLIRDDWGTVKERNEVRDKAMAEVAKPKVSEDVKKVDK